MARDGLESKILGILRTFYAIELNFIQFRERYSILLAEAWQEIYVAFYLKARPIRWADITMGIDSAEADTLILVTNQRNSDAADSTSSETQATHHIGHEIAGATSKQTPSSKTTSRSPNPGEEQQKGEPPNILSLAKSQGSARKRKRRADANSLEDHERMSLRRSTRQRQSSTDVFQASGKLVASAPWAPHRNENRAQRSAEQRSAAASNTRDDANPADYSLHDSAPFTLTKPAAGNGSPTASKAQRSGNIRNLRPRNQIRTTLDASAVEMRLSVADNTPFARSNTRNRTRGSYRAELANTAIHKWDVPCFIP